nr:hypothetical protein [Nanoarchaeum sp.]
IENIRNALDNNTDDATLTSILHKFSSEDVLLVEYPFCQLYKGQVYLVLPDGPFNGVKSKSDLENTRFYKKMVDVFGSHPYSFRVSSMFPTKDKPSVLISTERGDEHESRTTLVKITPTYLVFNPKVARRVIYNPGRKGLYNLETAVKQDQFLDSIIQVHSSSSIL